MRERPDPADVERGGDAAAEQHERDRRALDVETLRFQTSRLGVPHACVLDQVHAWRREHPGELHACQISEATPCRAA